MTVQYDLPAELLVEADGPVRTVTINRPDQLNAVNAALHQALADVWRQLSADRGARVVVLTGAGKTFCAGGDFDWLSSFLTDDGARDESLRQGAQIIEEMLRFPLPVIAAINGAAVGLGCSIALLCDIVLISERAHLADPHVPVGLVAGDGGAALWPLLTPLMRSREYLFTGDRIPAAKAVELGLATRTTRPEYVDGRGISPGTATGRTAAPGRARNKAHSEHAPVACTRRSVAGGLHTRGDNDADGGAPPTPSGPAP